MKTIKKYCAIILVCITLLCLASIHTFAASVTQDNIDFYFETTKDSYSENETITAVLKIANNGTEDITDIEWVNAVPDGYEFVDSSLEKQKIDVIHPNQVVELQTKFTVKNTVENSTTAPTVPNTTGNLTELNLTDATSAVGADATSTVGENTQVNTNASGAVQTGFENTTLLIVFVCAAISLGIFCIVKNKKKFYKLTSIFLCFALVLGAIPVFYAAEDDKQAQSDNSVTTSKVELEQNVNVGDNIVKLTSTVKYSLPSYEEDYNEKYYDDEKTFTKGEWVSIIIDKFDIEIGEFPEGFDYFYGDSAESDYGAVVETAQAYGLLPAPDSPGYVDPEQDVPLFEADKPATREFVAYTVAKTMGFEGEYSLEATDLDTIQYVNEVAVVVNQKFMDLIDSKFAPNNAITGADANMILNRIDYFNDSLEVKEGQEKDIIDYHEGVVTLDVDYTATESEEGIYTVELASNTDADASLTAGDVIVLSPNDEYIGGLAVKVNEVKTIDGKVVLICEEAKIEETIQDFDYAGHGVALVNKAETTEDVDVEYDPNGVVNSDEDVNAFDIGGSVSAGTLSYTLTEKEIKSGLKASGKIDISIPDVTAKAKGKIFGGLSLDELTLTVTDQVKFSGNLTYDFGIPESSYDVTTGKPKFGSGKTEIGRVPFALGTTGFTVDLVFFINLDVSGQLSISYSIDRTTGIQYKDGVFRNIKEYSSEFTAIEANGSAKLGVGMAVRLTLFSVFDIVGFDIHGGIGLTIKFTAHLDCEPDLFCGDGTVYLYLTLELDKDTIVGDLLDKVFNIELYWDIFDEDSSPLKKGIHIENLKFVDECTYGKGSLLGVVKDGQTGAKISGAQVKIYNKATGNLVKSGYTRTTDTTLADNNTVLIGEFFVQNLSAGSYQFDVKATGYKKASVDVDVVSGQRVVCEATLMVDRDHLDGLGTVSGSFTNALTGSSVENVQYEVRSGLNTKVGDVIASGTASNSYSIELVPGYYSVLFKKDGYVDELISVTITADENTVKNVALAPTSDISIDDSSFRVVLTWGEYPSDLDSHLYYFDDDGGNFHTCYYNKDYREGETLVANLDLDDTTSYGPETSTVYQVAENGVYSFNVHDYTNKDSDSCTAMSNSGAQVNLFSGSQLVATFNIPENRGGTLWHVFDYNSYTQEFVYVNEFSYANAG